MNAKYGFLVLVPFSFHAFADTKASIDILYNFNTNTKTAGSAHIKYAKDKVWLNAFQNDEFLLLTSTRQNGPDLFYRFILTDPLLERKVLLNCELLVPSGKSSECKSRDGALSITALRE